MFFFPMKLVSKLKKGHKKQSSHMYAAKLNRTFKVMRRLLCCSDFLAGGNDHVHAEVMLKLRWY